MLSHVGKYCTNIHIWGNPETKIILKILIENFVVILTFIFDDCYLLYLIFNKIIIYIRYLKLLLI